MLQLKLASSFTTHRPADCNTQPLDALVIYGLSLKFSLFISYNQGLNRMWHYTFCPAYQTVNFWKSFNCTNDTNNCWGVNTVKSEGEERSVWSRLHSLTARRVLRAGSAGDPHTPAQGGPGHLVQGADTRTSTSDRGIVRVGHFRGFSQRCFYIILDFLCSDESL